MLSVCVCVCLFEMLKCFVFLVFLQPRSVGGDYYQYDSTNAVNWQIKGK